MVGSFGSLSTALSALRYQQSALEVANNNIANSTTTGYARRTIVGSAQSTSQVAMWSRYTGHGDGVAVSDVRRMVDPLLDARMRREHSALSNLQTQATVLARIEEGIGEPGENGVAAALDTFTQSWQDLATNPGGDAARQQVLGSAAALAQALQAQYGNIAGEEADQQVRLATAVDEVNSVARDLAGLNHTILVGAANGTDVGDLRDQRDQLALRLADLAGATTTVEADGQFTVRIGTTDLVVGRTASAIGASPLPAGVSGEIGGINTLLTVTLPSYRAGLDNVATSLADAVNAAHANGVDRTGAQGGDFFSYDPASPAATLAVAITDIAGIAAAGISTLGSATLDGSNADAISGVMTAASDAYQNLVNTFGTHVASVNRQVANQEALTGSLDAAWESQAGVNLDEETVNLLSAQRAYEAAARMMTTLDEVLDTLINRTGVVGR
ncbi:flagellar hook-associated protein FlgK [Nocardioides sp. GY 10113]|uniref:flagellar hook-associated protein FlgK n=1 Tax=Nocardioides sp. GY 10113 TaxID=2569761 RepID=UPI0010A83C29|nr:flagellar hook-associated protein FlgK [Nocardioides sp. GY 10113]TIC85969.1 flagellar hook-associated protein FlgK [Nocardioides sp. GY 10113]